MRARIETACLWLVATAASLFLAFHFTLVMDYAVDGGPTIHALLHGDLGHLPQPAMGPFSILLRLPFAWLARGHSQLLEYRLGAVPCILAAGALGVHLARRALDAGRSRLFALGIVLFAVLNPANFHAMANGHPEEILGGALCVAAVVAASEGRSLLVTAALLGLALATKQWAVVAIGPVLLAAPRRRLAVALTGIALAAALTLPLMLSNPDGFATTTRTSAGATVGLTPASLWAPFEHVRHVRIFDGVAHRTIERRYMSPLLAGNAKKLIVALAALLPLAYWWRRRRPRAEDALLLLALLLALRCGLDPLTTAYYTAPLLLALLAHEVMHERGPPVLTTIAGAVIWYLTARTVWVIEPDKVTAIFLGWMVPLLAYLAARLYASSVTSALGKWLSTSLPSSVTITRSSIRTPNAPGR